MSAAITVWTQIRLLLLYRAVSYGSMNIMSDNIMLLLLLLLYITYELVVYSVNNRGPHGRLACILLMCNSLKIKTIIIIIIIISDFV